MTIKWQSCDTARSWMIIGSIVGTVACEKWGALESYIRVFEIDVAEGAVLGNVLVKARVDAWQQGSAVVCLVEEHHGCFIRDGRDATHPKFGFDVEFKEASLGESEGEVSFRRIQVEPLLVENIDTLLNVRFFLEGVPELSESRVQLRCAEFSFVAGRTPGGG